MNIDVCILAGGLGSRLAGVWDQPKCLAPVAGTPLIFRLLEQLEQLTPRTTVLALGHRACDVLHALRNHTGPHLDYCVESSPRGTAGALRLAIREFNLQTPLLVLNGDTLPFYDLRRLVEFHDRCGNIDASSAWHAGVHAGASVLNDPFILRLARSPEVDLSKFLIGTRYLVPGFLDVGTPYDFFRAQHLDLEEHPS